MNQERTSVVLEGVDIPLKELFILVFKIVVCVIASLIVIGVVITLGLLILGGIAAAIISIVG